MKQIYVTVYEEALKFINGYIGENGCRSIECVSVKPNMKNLNDVYRHLIDALLHTKRMKESVGDIDCLDTLLWGFNPKKTLIHYKNDWEGLHNVMKEDQEIETYDDLETFSRGAISGANLLTQLGSVRIVNAFVDGFFKNAMGVAVLPLLLQKEVYGLSFQGGCHFLNCIGYPDYVCMDQKVKALLQDIGLIESRDNYETLKTLLLIAKANAVVPEKAHLIFSFIAIEKLPEQDLKGQLRQPFIDHIIPMLEDISD